VYLIPNKFIKEITTENNGLFRSGYSENSKVPYELIKLNA
jgi:hypothetical protein